MKKNGKKSGDGFWYIVCYVIGFIALAVAAFIWRDYLSADVKFRADATLVLVEKEHSLRLKDKKIDEDDPFESDYEDYYDYTLTWRFTDPYDHKDRSFYTERGSTTNNLYSEGQKRTVFVYYREGYPDDFETADPGASLILAVVGVVFIGFATADLVAVTKRKKARKKMYEAMDAAKARYEASRGTGASDTQDG